MLLLASAPLSLAADGYCGKTIEAVGDCSADDSGSWPLKAKTWSNAAEECRQMCSECA